MAPAYACDSLQTHLLRGVSSFLCVFFFYQHFVLCYCISLKHFFLCFVILSTFCFVFLYFFQNFCSCVLFFPLPSPRPPPHSMVGLGGQVRPEEGNQDRPRETVRQAQGRHRCRRRRESRHEAGNGFCFRPYRGEQAAFPFLIRIVFVSILVFVFFSILIFVSVSGQCLP